MEDQNVSSDAQFFHLFLRREVLPQNENLRFRTHSLKSLPRDLCLVLLHVGLLRAENNPTSQSE